MQTRNIYFAAFFAFLVIAFSVSNAAAQELNLSRQTEPDGTVENLIRERIEKIRQDEDMSFEQVAKFLNVNAASAKRLDTTVKLLTKYETSFERIFIGRFEDEGGIAKKEFDEYLAGIGLQNPTGKQRDEAYGTLLEIAVSVLQEAKKLSPNARVNVTKSFPFATDWNIEFAEQCNGKAITPEEAVKIMEKAKPRIALNPEEAKRKAGERMVLKIEGVEYAFRWCPAGTFTMGSPSSEEGRLDRETQHQVTLTRGFWMLETPVTQAMWKSVTGNNPSYFEGDKLPVERVSWEDCQEFVEQLNRLKVAPAGYKFSLPTESQWEYACRAGTTTPFHFGSVLNGDKANCDGNYPYGTSTKGRYLKKTSEVGAYPANAWGLYDMHGNVWEWCLDWYGDYPSGAVTDPTGADKDSHRVLRGGGWNNSAMGCRSAHRGIIVPSGRNLNYGVRISLVRVE